MDELFKNESQRIKIYLAIESQEDPYEKNTSLSELPSLPINAIVTDLTFSKIQWSMPGLVTDTAKEIIIEKRHKNLFEQSYKIEINGEFYDSWRVNGRCQYKIEQNYLRAYIYLKKEE
jgi:PBP1b-binding outer membrane lipoprotein LpoB